MFVAMAVKDRTGGVAPGVNAAWSAQAVRGRLEHTRHQRRADS